MNKRANDNMIINVDYDGTNMKIKLGIGDLDDGTVTIIYADPKNYDKIGIVDTNEKIKNKECAHDTIGVMCRYAGDNPNDDFQFYQADYIIVSKDVLDTDRIGFIKDTKFKITPTADGVVIYDMNRIDEYPLLKSIIIKDKKKKNKKKKEENE